MENIGKKKVLKIFFSGLIVLFLCLFVTGCISTVNYSAPQLENLSVVEFVDGNSIALRVIDARPDSHSNSKKIPVVPDVTYRVFTRPFTLSDSLQSIFYNGIKSALIQKGYQVDPNSRYLFEVKIVQVSAKTKWIIEGKSGVVQNVVVDMQVSIIDRESSKTIFTDQLRRSVEHKDFESRFLFSGGNILIPDAVNNAILGAVEVSYLNDIFSTQTEEPEMILAKEKELNNSEEVEVYTQLLSEPQKAAVPSLSIYKTALIIGNGNYEHFPNIANPVPEAIALASVLQDLGFTVFQYSDLSYEEMLDAIFSFETYMKKEQGLAFFHYGGHGVQVNGKNYLIPVNADIPDEARVRSRAIEFQEVASALEASGSEANIMILDACRDNPLPVATRSGTRGLSVELNQPPNSVLVYAAEAGTKAIDGVFTPTLIKYLKNEPDEEFSNILRKMRGEVWNITSGTQRPGEYNQLISEIYLTENHPETN